MLLLTLVATAHAQSVSVSTGAVAWSANPFFGDPAAEHQLWGLEPTEGARCSTITLLPPGLVAEQACWAVLPVPLGAVAIDVQVHEHLVLRGSHHTGAPAGQIRHRSILGAEAPLRLTPRLRGALGGAVQANAWTPDRAPWWGVAVVGGGEVQLVGPLALTARASIGALPPQQGSATVLQSRGWSLWLTVRTQPKEETP